VDTELTRLHVDSTTHYSSQRNSSTPCRFQSRPTSSRQGCRQHMKENWNFYKFFIKMGMSA